MTKRKAILFTAAAMLGLMTNRAKTESSGSVAKNSSTITALQVFPQTVTFNFDLFDKFIFICKGESVTFTGDEIFEALKQK